jgi:O-antigen ligase
LKEPNQLNKYDKAVVYWVYSLFLMPVLPKLVGNILIGLFLMFSLIAFVKNDRRKFNSWFFVLTSLLYFSYIISAFYSENLDYALKKLGTAIPLLVFPLAFSVLSNRIIESIKANIKNYIKTYVATVLIISAVLILENLNIITDLDRFHDHVLKEGTVIGIDALYLSLYLAIALISTVYLYYLSKKLWKGVAAVLIIIALFVLLLILSFKSAIISFVIAFGLYALMINKVKLWALFMSATLIVIGLLTFSSVFNQKFNRLLIVKNAADIEYAEIKKTIQTCSIELIPEAGLFGFGLGDGKDELINCFDGKNKSLKEVSYNSHNQYLSIFLNVGLVGLILFSISLFILLFVGLNNRNYLGIAILVLFGVFMLAENVLERQQGVVYFALFLNILFIENFKIRRSSPLILTHEKVIDSFN